MRIHSLLALSALCLSFHPLSSLAGEKSDTQDKMKEMMKKHAEYATPGEPHQALAALAGKWTYLSKWWAAPEAKPEESRGHVTFKMVLGGRYLQQEMKGKAMGRDFEAIGYTAFDNLKKKYYTVFLDNMGTGVVRGQGEFDAQTRTYTDKGEFTCPMSADHQGEYRSEWKIVDAKRMTYTMYGTGLVGKGPEFKTMEMTYTRK